MSPVPIPDADSDAAFIGIREFARRDGCDPKLVRNAIQRGRLQLSPDDKLAANLVGSGWRFTNRKGGDTLRAGAETLATQAGTLRQLSPVPAPVSPAPPQVDALAGVIADVPFMVARALLPHLPRSKLEPVLEALRLDLWRIAAGSLEADVAPPPPIPAAQTRPPS